MTSSKAPNTEGTNPEPTKPKASSKVRAPRILPAEPANPFLPDLCSSQSVFLLVLVAELLAVLLTISASSGLQHFNWDKLALISVQVQWIVVFSAVALCRLRFWLGRQDHVRAGAASYALVLGITFILCIAGQWIIYGASGMAFIGDQEFNFDGWLLLNSMVIAAILSGILLRYLYLQQQLRNQQQAEMQARIQALQSRIRPHFLFNSMNSIASLIATDPDTAERVVEDLSELFRASLAEPTLIPLGRELELCKHYLDIEQLRLGRRLQLDWQVSSCNPAIKIPSLMMQPLVENAIFHGIEPLPKGGTITVKVSQNDKQLSIVISNPYLLAKKNHRTSEQAQRHNRMALDNIRRRLTAHFGTAARLSSSAENGIFTTYIFCPLTL
ncbi:MAG: histidine kinase [Cellvibrio sp.]|uniref:sensor histidine kinase n=1 Tax=Cellvibrio sp. TaxID=1965322 RepID=UPI002724650E|nr:histidine kinase [Cellvibrio sp.]